MRRTLLFIPHEVAGLPVFGVGWLLMGLVLFVIGRLIWARRSGLSIGEVVSGEGLLWAIVAAAVVFVLPSVELKNLDGMPVGVAIRGYGVFLLIAVISSVALAMVRARRGGMNPDVILSLAFWVFPCGIAGARLFYVIQYSENFVAETTGQTIRNMLMFNEGGLVVYGSFIGGFLATVGFVLWKKVSLLQLGDIVVPCIFLGVFFGRIGCLMNGCCYGGRCEESAMALHFPPRSPVYEEQLMSGELIGLRVDPETGEIISVTEGSLADQRGITAGQVLRGASPLRPEPLPGTSDLPAESVPRGWVFRVSQRDYVFSADVLPARALPVQAAQLISSVSSLVLCILLLLISRWSLPTGTVMFLGFAGYAILRFVLELVRVDEGGQFETSLTISQWVSVLVLLSSVAGWVWLRYAKREPT